MSDIENIIRNCQKGQRKAQKELYEQFAPKMMGVCLYYTSDRHEAEDVLHEGFMRAFQKINQLREPKAFNGWLRRIFVHCAIEKHRQKRWTYDVNDSYAYDERLSYEDIRGKIEEAELLQLVHELPPQYRLVFNLYAIEGFKHREIAEKLGISAGTSKSNLARARSILQQKVIARYGLNKQHGSI